GAAPPEAADFQMLPGRGVSATVAGHHLIAGNRELLTEENVPWESLSRAAVPALEQGCTVIYVAVDGRPAGFLALADTLRPDAAGTIRDVQATGVTPVLLTGDHEKAARHIAGELGIGTFQAECLPEDKLAWIDHSQESGRLVCMVGDGINDAPALKRAHVGIAMGGVGSDIAVDAADIALVNDDIRELPHLLALSRRMMRTIKCNLAFSMTLNFIAIALAITGILNPVVGALVHNAGSVLVIVNSSLLLKWRKRP
ncbi:heavy metal translocating P-type ATPase, partial [Oscillibacter sp.]|uniref:heavy metal translocating P-type ATPase n=1 Tax=Oscillibacter sp. TaxID=1945593 RepID=UPI002D7F6340